jgi:hypothetical protein
MLGGRNGQKAGSEGGIKAVVGGRSGLIYGVVTW